MTASEYHYSDSISSSSVSDLVQPVEKSESAHHSSHRLNDSTNSLQSSDPHSDPHFTATGIYVTVHGHFYQPPRENPYLNVIERQPSAAAFHDWNERIHYECYRPNAFARVLNDREEVIGIVNNFEYLSFNVGPTLMSWIERHDVEVYRRIIEADRKSCERLNGHGNAIAQVYNHIIMPLANQRDKYTQIRWGKADFRSRFGRDPEGMWLAETAVDYATLEALVNEGIKFIILAPSQAQRCRPIPTPENPDPDWREVGGSQIDPIQPYRCYLRHLNHSSDPHSLPYIDIFFYDGPISRDMGFDDVLRSSGHFAGRIGQAIRGDHRPSQLIAVATDGETFGHHKGGTEKALAYAFTEEFPRRGWTVTNFAHYLSLSAPTWEVELKPVTAWSCSHGVDRWQEDCGCGGGGHWNQKWRRPLRDSLDWLRDQLIKVYEDTGRKFFTDPWTTRDEYIEVMLDRSPVNVNRFFSLHQTRRLTGAEKVDALRLLEMQRHTLLMYTSCGWFFDELSRPEGTQILRYAARAIELAADVAGVQLEKGFIRRLAAAPSNVEFFRNGAEVYRQLVIPAQVSLDQVAAHYAITSLFTSYPRDERVYCYTVHQLDYQLQRLGNLTLAVGQIQLTSEITWESSHLIFAVLHLGGWDFHCCIRPFSGRRNYSQMKDSLFDALRQASAAQTILAMNHSFGDQSYSLQSLFAEERHRIMRLLSQETLTRLDQLYTQVYRDNYGVLSAFHRDTLNVPQELQVAAEIAISHRAITALQALEREASEFPLSNPQVCLSHLIELEAIAAEADHLHCQLKLPEIKQILERIVYRSFRSLLTGLNPTTVEADIEWINRLLTLANKLHLHLTLDRTQELFFQILHLQILPQLAEHYRDQESSLASGISLAIGSTYSDASNPHSNLYNDGYRAPVDLTTDRKTQWTVAQLKQLLQLGQRLTIDVQYWLGLLGE